MKRGVKLINRLSRAMTCFLFVALLSIGVGLGSNPAEAQPFAYITNFGSNPGTVSVINTANNSVSAAVTVGSAPFGVAVHPAGTFVYVTNFGDGSNPGTVSVIDTTNNNTVTATVTVGSGPTGVAVHPAGTSVYVANQFSNTVSVIDTASNTVTGLPVPVGFAPTGVAVNPAGSRVYVTNQADNTVSVIDTADNTVTGLPVPVGSTPIGVAVHPLGTSVYVANQGSNTVSVIDTTTNTVTDTVTVGDAPVAFGQFIGPGAVSAIVAFAALNAKVEIEDDEFEVKATFTLGAGSDGINPITEDVSLQVGTFSTTIPAGSFKLHPEKSGKKGKHVKPNKWTFEGVIDGVKLEAKITDLGGESFEFKAEGEGANLAGTMNPVQVGIIIGNDGGNTTVTAEFD